VKLLSEFGVQLFLEVASGLDIEIQRVVQQTVAQLASSRGTRQLRTLSLVKGTDRDFPAEILDQTESFAFTDDVQLDDNFQPIGASTSKK